MLGGRGATRPVGYESDPDIFVGYVDGGIWKFGSVMSPAARVMCVVRSTVTRARRGANGSSATASSATF